MEINAEFGIDSSSQDDKSSLEHSESDEDSYHPNLSKVSIDPLVVRVSNASKFCTMTPAQPRFKLRLSMKRKENSEVTAATRSSGRSTKSKKYSDIDNDDDLLEEIETTNAHEVSSRTRDEKVHECTNIQKNAPLLMNVEAPPPGVLSSLWYSNESVLHIFVIDKILGWKERPVTSPRRGMDESRLVKTETSTPNESMLDVSSQAGQEESKSCKEEVLLIKWRGKSFLHCSWERMDDLIRLDPTKTAKGKITRYFQSQELAIGPHWKQLLTDTQVGVQEDYFPPTYIEVERVLASDETEMDMSIFSKQRGLNLISQKQALRSKVAMDTSPVDSGTLDSSQMWSADENECETSKEWDPEDYVRYVIKWKGLPAAEITWEYWKDIKTDFVDVVEDYWLRQKRPSVSEMRSKSHPNMRDFKKLKESPIFGLSNVERPIIGHEYDNETESEADENEVTLRLREYQLEGVNWLLWNWWNHRSCILADEMGLGKTIQTMAFLEQLHRLKATRVRGPFLVVAPLTLVAQWQSEAAAWAPDFSIIVYHGSADARSLMVNHEFFYREPFVSKAEAQRYQRNHITKFHLLITTYEVVMKDVNILSKIRWKALVVDEAHRLKNKKSRLFADLSSVPRDFCLLLTGTPLQNSTEELWALLNFAEPEAFASGDAFIEQFGQLTDAQQVRDLHSILKPYLLRRVKEDVEKSLPPKQETILEVSLTPIQKTFYKAIYEKNTQFLFKGAKPSNSPSLMNVMMELRKCCNHPFLIRGAEQRILEDVAGKTIPLQTILDKKHAFSPEALNRFPEQLVKSSGKMVLIDKLLPKLKDGGHKVLIFSQMVKVLDLLEDLLRIKNYRYERLDGSVNASSRQAAVHRFHSKTYDRFVMLLSTRAGGLGLNLTAADTVIIFDSDWNPQNDLQAMARAHRIGQTKAVRVYRLLTSKTYEMHMFHSASMKLGLDRAVLAQQRQNDAEEYSAKSSKVDRENQAREIDELLKKGAYDIFRDDNDDEATTFMETDIEDLLKKSSRTVTYGNGSSNVSSGLGSFSKASFVASGDDVAEVDLDDPDFWVKAVGLEAPQDLPTDSDTSFLAGLESKRSRKQVQVYDPFAAFADRERKKQEKVIAKLKTERDEKEKKRSEEKKKRQEEKERRIKDKELAKLTRESHVSALPPKPIQAQPIFVKTKAIEKVATKKAPNSLKRRMMRVAEEKLYGLTKQVWGIKERDSVLAQLLKFGFRCTKIRHESNLMQLPVQDVEVFLRSCIYQLGIQAGVSIMTHFIAKKGVCDNESYEFDSDNDMKGCIYDVLSLEDGIWIGDSIFEALKMRENLSQGVSVLRLPSVIAEPSFLSVLRKGASIRILQRLAFLTRFNRIMAKVIDDIFKDLGQDELGKRGCPEDLLQLDLDSKLNYITTNELISWLSCVVSNERPCHEWVTPCSWWNRSCDLGLIVGSLYHGLGSYRKIQEDPKLPFSEFLSDSNKDNSMSRAVDIHECVINQLKNVFEQAIHDAKFKASEKVAATVSEEVVAAISAERTPIDTSELNSVTKSSTSGVETLSNSSYSENILLGAEKSGIGVTNSVDYEPNHYNCLTLETTLKCARRAMQYSQHGHNQSNKQLRRMPDAKVLDTLLFWLINSLEIGPHPVSINSKYHEDSVTLEKEDLAIMNTMESQLLIFSSFYADSLKIQHEGEDMAAAYLTNCLFSLRGTGIIEHLDDGSNIVRGVANPSLFLHQKDRDEFLKVSDMLPTGISRLALIALVNTDLDQISKIEEGHISTDDVEVDRLINTKDQITICIACLTLGFFEASCTSPNLGIDTDFLKPLFEYLRKIFHGQLSNSIPCFEKRCLLSIDDVLRENDLSERVTPSACENFVANKVIPHCIRLCLYERNDNVWNNTKGRNNLCTLPYPGLPLDLHSDEAVLRSAALLRRISLMKTVRSLVCDNHLKAEELIAYLKSAFGSDDEVVDVPIWWDPSIHDLALFVCAAKYGLFAVLKLRNQNSVDSLASNIFSDDAITQHIRYSFLDTKQKTNNDSIIPKQVQKDHPTSVNAWIKVQAKSFPTAQIIEQRIVRICEQFASPSKATTTDYTDGDSVLAYYSMPMFDHRI